MPPAKSQNTDGAGAGDWRPVPDPTELTNQAVAAAVDMLRRELMSFREVLETRLAAMDKATDLLRQSQVQVPSDVDIKIQHLQSLHEEKFRSIGIQFLERDTRTEQTSRDSKVAVDAALQAAKEAVGEQNKSSALAIAKSEAGTAKLLDQLGVQIGTTTAGLNDKIDDIKSRLTLIEGKGYGQQTAETRTQTNSGLNISIIGAFVAAAALIVGIIAIFMKAH